MLGALSFEIQRRAQLRVPPTQVLMRPIIFLPDSPQRVEDLELVDHLDLIVKFIELVDVNFCHCDFRLSLFFRHVYFPLRIVGSILDIQFLPLQESLLPVLMDPCEMLVVHVDKARPLVLKCLLEDLNLLGHGGQPREEGVDVLFFFLSLSPSSQPPLLPLGLAIVAGVGV